MGSTFLDPAASADPTWLQRLAWFLGHWEVWGYGPVLIAGIILWIRRGILRDWPVLLWLAVLAAAICFAGFFVWAQTQYRVGMTPDLRAIHHAILAPAYALIATPVVVGVWRSVRALLAAGLSLPVGLLGVVAAALLVLGVVSSVILAAQDSGSELADTFYALANLQFSMAMAAGTVLLAAWYHLFERLWGASCNRLISGFQIAAYLSGITLVLVPQFVLGFADMPRRYVDHAETVQIWQTVSSVGFAVLGMSLVLLILSVIEITLRRR